MSTSKRKRRVFRGRRVIIAGSVAGHDRGHPAGYGVGRNSSSAPGRGHVTTTGSLARSLKAIGLGLWRIQWCPVGRHDDWSAWSSRRDLTESERAFAARHHAAGA